MTKAREMADLLDANGDVKATSLDNVPPSEWSTVANKPSLALSDGTGATGSWPIAITGNAATATSATTATTANSATTATTANSANAVAWSNVSGIPATATSWPSWGNVTGKPTVYGNCSNCSGTVNAAGNCYAGTSGFAGVNLYLSGTSVHIRNSNCNCDCRD